VPAGPDRAEEAGENDFRPEPRGQQESREDHERHGRGHAKVCGARDPPEDREQGEIPDEAACGPDRNGERRLRRADADDVHEVER
jgi:hypothetical protein